MTVRGKSPACRVRAEGEEMTVLKKRRQVWTKDEEERLRQFLLNNAQLIDIAVALGRSEDSVSSKAYTIGMPVGRFGNPRQRGAAKWG